MLEVVRKYEHVVVMVLVTMMSLVLGLAVVDLGWILVQEIIAPPRFLLGIEQLLHIFGLFLLALIGVELVDTVKAYILESVIHLKVVLTVAMIAIARKVIILDPKDHSPASLLGIAALILALAVGYYLVSRSPGGRKTGNI